MTINMGNGFDIHGNPANEAIVADLVKQNKITVRADFDPEAYPIPVTDIDLKDIINNLKSDKKLLAFGEYGNCHVWVEKIDF